MGRFETLNPETKDLIECMLPNLASQFNVIDIKDIIPEDIRMRAWDCERRDHIKDETENDPRNWGVQFLKDLTAIARIKKGDLAEFHQDLRAKVVLHEAKHPWCRLQDIKDLKYEYEHPGCNDVVEEEQMSSEDSYDSYFEELVEPEQPKGGKSSGSRKNHEIYEARTQESSKRRKMAAQGRLRRSEGGGFARRPKKSKYSHTATLEYSDNEDSSPSRVFRTVQSDFEESLGHTHEVPNTRPVSAFSNSPTLGDAQAQMAAAVIASNRPVAVQKLQAELDLAEAELRAARLRVQFLQALEQAEMRI